MSVLHRVESLLSKADLLPPPRISVLDKSIAFDFEISDPIHRIEARSLLAAQRRAEPGYQRPENQKRHIFRSKGQKDKHCNEEHWVFSASEVAKAFNGILSQAVLPSWTLPQALLSYSPGISLEELWRQHHGPSLGKKAKKSSDPPQALIVPEISWLDTVTSRGNVNYIRLMCQTGLGQDALTRSFSIALSKQALDAMELLLAFGAVASGHQDVIREHVKIHDFALVKLLLSAPNSMTIEAWRYCLEPELEHLKVDEDHSSDILLYCLAHRPEVVCTNMLIKALESQNFPATTIVLAYADDMDSFRDVRKPACRLVTLIRDSKLRHKFFTVLAERGLVTDGPILRKELMRNVEIRQLSLIRLLVDAGVILDIEPHNSLHWAISHMALDVMVLFKNGICSSPVSPLLHFIPGSAPERDVIQLLEILGPRGLAGESLDELLISAVLNSHLQLVMKLLHLGASIEFRQAFAVRIALNRSDFQTLGVLLEAECSQTLLSTTIDIAMILEPRDSRLRAMKALLKKGITERQLGLSLQQLLLEDGELDYDLLELFLQHQAPLDGIGHESDNPVLVVTRKGILPALEMLCNASPEDSILLEAIAIAFNTRQKRTYTETQQMITILLRSSSANLAIHDTFLNAVRHDKQLCIVRLLAAHGADANHANGAAFISALKTGNHQLLDILCTACPPSQVNAQYILATAVTPRFYDLQDLNLLLTSTTSLAAGLSGTWAVENLSGNTRMTAFVPLLLEHGLNVDIGDGDLICLAVECKDINLLDRLISANPSMKSLRKAFATAVAVQPREFQLHALKIILEEAKSIEIGQSKALSQETRFALAGDSGGLELLLFHGAFINVSTIKLASEDAINSPMSLDQKQVIFKKLLRTSFRLSLEELSDILHTFVVHWSELEQLSILLIQNGAQAKYSTLHVAMLASSRGLFTALVNSTQSLTALQYVFTDAHATIMTAHRRYWIYKSLLDRNIRMPVAQISQALLDFLKSGCWGDMSCIKLLLEHHADVGYQGARAFSLALRASSLEAVRLLSQHLADDCAASNAFRFAQEIGSMNEPICLETCRCLLGMRWRIDESLLNLTLQKIFEQWNRGPEETRVSLVEQLLARGADPNHKEAQCFVKAASKHMLTEFKALSRYAKPSIVLKALLRHFDSEEDLVEWAATLWLVLQESTSSEAALEDELLFLCLKKFPSSSKLLLKLFDLGLSASAETTYALCENGEPEDCTALIWALFSRAPRIRNEVICAILAQGKDAGLSHTYCIS